MKRVAFILLFVLTGTVLAQKQQETFSFPRYSLQFKVTDLLRFNPFLGSIISFKYHLNNKTAFRIGISGSKKTSDTDVDKFTADTLSGKTRQKESLTGLGLRFQVVRYFNPTKVIKAYAGCGPYVFWNYKKLENDSYYTSTLERRTYSVGINGFWGAEWFFASRMSLSLEYGFYFGYYHKKEDRKNVQEASPEVLEKRTNTVWQFDDNSVLFGLTVYF